MTSHRSPFYAKLTAKITALGGMHNAHLHLDRAGTIDEEYITVAQQSVLATSHISLHQKHHLIYQLHAGPAYDDEDFRERITYFLNDMIANNTRRADTLVDVTADNLGLSALHRMQDIKRQYQDKISLNIAAYSPFGFKDSEPQRWELFAAGAAESDFIAALPEADDRDEYPDHIGFDEHLARTIELARNKRCMLHVHSDQRNEDSESGTERLVKVIKKQGALSTANGEPLVWAVHMISPSTYDEKRFQHLVNGLLECNIGVICCPSAAIGMRQLRSLPSPTFNSIPRVLELLEAGVHVRLASDNIADICSPSTTANLIDELFMLSAAIRYYDVDILAKLAVGKKLNSAERVAIREHLNNNNIEIAKVLANRAQIYSR
ncbi:hypothetical protein [Zhongshania sp.]|uniref:hypothetical protein n=1 Tax=Zhongshania sp. TaxID=1971902 RepID=UPI0035642BA1